jgi:predicted regulator of Ras-like GTPase activity (Roadblock/LC7/MglB family)
MADPSMTPELALRYLDELSTDVRGAILLGPDGAVAASSGPLAEDPDAAAELVRRLLDRADAAAGGQAPGQVEVTLPAGAVFAVRQGAWILAAVTSRLALSSLMFYDLRSVLSDLDRKAA